MSVHITDLQDPNRFLHCNAWNWRPTAELIVKSGLLSDEDKEPFAAGHGGLDESQSKALAYYFRTNILPALSTGNQIKLDGQITREPGDGRFHRKNLAENYSASQEWLEEFIRFIETCKGFCVI